MTVNSVNEVASNRQNNVSKSTKRPSQIVVKNGENINTLAKKFNMSKEEFVKWAGLKTMSLKVGQRISLPTAEVATGKGIYSLISKYGMTFDEFGKINNLPKPYNKYSASKGEVFYVKPKSKNSDKTSLTERKWGSKYTPKEISSALEKEADNRWGAVGKDSFDNMLKEINSKNASAVIKSYDEAKYGQSLINRITHEVMSDEKTRKESVMHVYDALAKEKNVPASKREEFRKELDARFEDWGMVDTTNLDKMINEIISGKIANNNAKVKSKTLKTSPTKVDGRNVKVTSNGKVFTISTLQRGAINSAKSEAITKYAEFCKEHGIPYRKSDLDLAPLERIPAPEIKNGRIVTSESELLKPTTKPNGKVVILNSGHGGYSSRTGYYDTGAYSFIKKGNGKYAPLLEAEKMRIYAESMSEKLRSEGYAVVLLNGHAQTMSDQNSISNLVKNLSTGKKANKKYSKNDIAFISLHADSEKGKSGTGVCYDSNFVNDSKFANVLNNNLNTDDWISANLSQRNWGEKGLLVLHQTETIPSVLVEVEYVNGSKSKNLDSSAFQNRFENKLLSGLNEYFGV